MVTSRDHLQDVAGLVIGSYWGGWGDRGYRRRLGRIARGD
jgi:hypothetical protein